jgi:hypothetical protein
MKYINQFRTNTNDIYSETVSVDPHGQGIVNPKRINFQAPKAA